MITAPVMLFSAAVASYITGQHTQISITNNILSNYNAAWYGFKNRLGKTYDLQQNFVLSLNFLQQQFSFPTLEGKTDIYSYDQSALISSGMHWSPRPIFQSYSVFTPYLALKNQHFLLGKQSPDNIIFKVEAIDERLPSLEDGPGWPILLQSYQPTGWAQDFLILKKKAFHPNNTALHLLQTEHHKLNENIALPALSQPVFVQIQIKPTWWGRVITFLFRPNPLAITLKLKDGTVKSFRIVANMAASGFLLSPLIENTQDFASLYKSGSMNKNIASFRITSESSYLAQWQEKYTIRFKTMAHTSVAQI